MAENEALTPDAGESAPQTVNALLAPVKLALRISTTAFDTEIESLIEAAKLDGANEWQVFTRVSLPLCQGALFSVAILVFIDYWNMVEQPLILLRDEKVSATHSGDTKDYSVLPIDELLHTATAQVKFEVVAIVLCAVP